MAPTLKLLALGTSMQVTYYSSYVVKGKRYCIKSSEKTTQDSGVSLEVETVSNEKDSTQVVKKMVYYGVLREILLLDFFAFHVSLFRCDWMGSASDVREEDEFTLVNFSPHGNRWDRDPFILASQATQVFYSRENDNSNWYVVLRAPPRGFHDLEKFDEHAYMKSAPLDVSDFDASMNDSENYARMDCEELVVNM